MNYRHAFHAGNFADVLKHLVLSLVITHLAKKAAPFRIIDTHAGTGLYDLSGVEAQKTGEWRDGIGRLMAMRDSMPAGVALALAPYLDLLESDLADDEIAGGHLVRYPGSPLIARRLMRAGDQLVANELHPEDRERLAELFHRDPQAKVMGLDGYTALKALLPPKERRGLVLVDPPFEVVGEFDRLAGAVAAAHRRFATGVLMLWFPIKVRGDVDRFYARLAEAGVGKALSAELQVAEQTAETKGLVATGVVVVNPPFTLASDLSVILPYLAQTLATGPGATAHWRWIVEEGAKQKGSGPGGV